MLLQAITQESLSTAQVTRVTILGTAWSSDYTCLPTVIRRVMYNILFGPLPTATRSIHGDELAQRQAAQRSRSPHPPPVEDRLHL